MPATMLVRISARALRILVEMVKEELPRALHQEDPTSSACAMILLYVTMLSI
jgi:hypothetical protein